MAADASAEYITSVVKDHGTIKTVTVGGAVLNGMPRVVTEEVRKKNNHSPHWLLLTPRIDNVVTTGAVVHHEHTKGICYGRDSNVALNSKSGECRDARKKHGYRLGSRVGKKNV